MPKNSYKINKTLVRKAIKTADRPTYAAISKLLGVHPATVKLFLFKEENAKLLELLNSRRCNILKAANTLIEDSIIEGDKKLALEWVKFTEKKFRGEKINLEGDLNLNIHIKKKDDDEKENKK